MTEYGGASQAEGVLAPGREPDEGREGRERIEPVREGEQDPLGRARQRVSGSRRPVLVVDRLRGAAGVPLAPLGRLAADVDPARDPLQLGELAHQPGGQVALGQARGGAERPGVGGPRGRLSRLPGAAPAASLRSGWGRPLLLAGVDDGPQRERDRLDPARFLGVGAGRGVERHVLELRDAAREGHLAVLVEEEARVLEPPDDDPLVPLADVPLGVPVGVGDHEEAVRHPFVRLGREGLLVVAQRGDQDLARELQELGGERSEGRPGELHEVGDLLEKLGVLDRADSLLPRDLHESPRQGGAAGLAVGEDLLRRERLLVRGGRPDGDLPGAEEPVAVGFAPCADAEERQGHELAPEQGHHPVHRPHEAARPVPPAHRLGERHRGDGLRERLREDLRRAPPGDPAPDREVVPLRRRDGQQRGRLHAHLLREAEGRLRRLPVGPGGRLRGRSQDLLVPVLLPQRDALDQDGDAARRAEGARLAARKAGRLQNGADAGGKVLDRAAQHAGGDLLAADLEQEVGAAHAAPPCSAAAARARNFSRSGGGSRGKPASRRSSRYRLAHRTARARILWM